MEWKCLKLCAVSAITFAVVTHVARKVYKKLSPEKPKEDGIAEEAPVLKKREINDVLMFSDNLTYHYIKPASDPDNKLCLTRSQQNSYKLLKYLKSAQETLDVCMYLITSNEIAESIIRLGQRHVMVRVIVDGDMASSGGSQVKRLNQYSFISVQSSKTSNLMHHKFCIIDGPMAIKRKTQIIEHAEKMQAKVWNAKCRPHGQVAGAAAASKGFVMSGSLNWSAQALNGSCDNVIVTSQPHVVHKFEKEFSYLWEDPRIDLSSRINEKIS